MIEALEVRATGPVEGYPYQWTAAEAAYAVDPEAPASKRIADLGLAPRDPDGMVRFRGDVVLLRPDDGGCRRALLSVPNRGMTLVPFGGTRALAAGVPAGLAAPPEVGDGFLLRRGWTVALVGWQWNVPRGTGLAGLDAPLATVEPGWLRSDARVEAPAAELFGGVLAEIASARRGEFNRRYAQPGLLSPLMPEYGPPYDTTALLARQREQGGVPKVMLTNSAWEYWRGDGALVHQDPDTGADLPEDPDARTYLISGTDHLGPALAIKRNLPVANPPHGLDPGPVVRALFVQLEQWAVDGTEPAPSAVPRQSDGTAVTRESVLEAFPGAFPGAARPDPAVLPYTPAIDPELVRWPLPLGRPRVALVSAVDAAGNEVAGIRLPAVECGIAAYTGWNPRRPVPGLPDVLYDMVGSRLPAPEGRPAPAPGRDELLAAARRLAERRFLLEEDVETAVRQALRN